MNQLNPILNALQVKPTELSRLENAHNARQQLPYGLADALSRTQVPQSNNHVATGIGSFAQAFGGAMKGKADRRMEGAQDDWKSWLDRAKLTAQAEALQANAAYQNARLDLERNRYNMGAAEKAAAQEDEIARAQEAYNKLARYAYEDNVGTFGAATNPSFFNRQTMSDDSIVRNSERNSAQKFLEGYGKKFKVPINIFGKDLSSIQMQGALKPFESLPGIVAYTPTPPPASRKKNKPIPASEYFKN